MAHNMQEKLNDDGLMIPEIMQRRLIHCQRDGDERTVWHRWHNTQWTTTNDALDHISDNTTRIKICSRHVARNQYNVFT